MSQIRNARWSLVVAVAAVIVLTVAGLVLLGVYWHLSRQSSRPTGVDPVQSVSSSAVAPDLAVLILAGEPDERVIDAALAAGETETACATLAYSLLLPDNLRGGNWLLLARALAEASPARAAIAHRAALDVASLGPTLNDLARADLSLQAARGFISLDQPSTAGLALAQAEHIARYGLHLLPSQRRVLLTRVVEMQRDLGDAGRAGELASRIDEYSAGPGVTVEAPTQRMPALRGAVEMPASVVRALAARQQAAAALAARWLSADQPGRESLLQSLGEALRGEDAARAVWYEGADELSDADRLALLHDQAAWLAVKHRTARGDFGASLVPEWEGQGDEIAAALAETNTSLVNGYGRRLSTLDASGALQARVELLRQALLWARLGLFPGQAEEQLSGQLADASQQVWTRQGGAGLTVAAQDVDGQSFYLLTGIDAERTEPVR